MRTYFPSSTGDSNWDMDDVQVVEKATAGAKAAFLFKATNAFELDRNRKLELMLPTRDGVYLHTLIYLPKGADEDGAKFTAVVDRSPYGYGDMEWITDIFLPLGFVAVGQDMRGTEKSGGNFTMWASDSEDSIDLGDWIVRQPWSNGQIYTFGASADGIGSLQTIVHNPSWLGAQYIAWCSNDMYNILFSGGAYKQKTTEDWLLGLTMPVPETVNADIALVRAGENGLNQLWESINIGPDDFKNVKAKSAFWGGWYDLFQVGLLSAFEGYNTQSDPSVRYTSVLTMDPLGHCVEGAEFFPQNAVEGRTALILGQLFEVYGIRPVSRSGIKNITFYVMSSNDEAGLAVGQYWSTLESWPKPVMTDYYFHADKSASTSLESTPDASSTYRHDPADPVPTMGGNNLPDSIGGTIPCGPLDQAEVDLRSDVLTFQTAVFNDPLALTGPLLATLFVSSDAIDTDFMVKISDVYPTGEARLLQDSAVRMRWRDHTVDPQYLVPGEIYEVEVMLWNTSYIVAPGHALRFSVASSNFPRFSVNPNNGLLLMDPLYPGANITATNTLYHNSKFPSKVSLPVVNKRQLPETKVVKGMQTAFPDLMTDDTIKRFSGHLDKMLKRMDRRQHRGN